MKAIIGTKYGPPEVPQQREFGKLSPSNDEVCMRVHATVVTASDVFVLGSELPLQEPGPSEKIILLRARS